jgi:hypothetical protein
MNPNQNGCGRLYSEEARRKRSTFTSNQLFASVLDIRKFEIELYWKRAQYFWAFIIVAFSAYGYAYFKFIDDPSSDIIQEILVLISCSGIFVSVAWVLVNKGSKYWQENWESHLDLIEDEVCGPLYKTKLEEKNIVWFDSIFSAGAYSVTKINLIICYYVCFLWVILLFAAFKCPACNAPHWLRILFMIGVMIVFCCLLFSAGRTGKLQKTVYERRRTTILGD